MPVNTSFQHLPNATARDKLEHRVTVAKGSSPFHADEPRPVPIDTGITASCTCCSPPRRFVGTAGRTPEEWLASHVEGLTEARSARGSAREASNAKRRASYVKQKKAQSETDIR